jgi:multimeric flavodoxin WrbA
MDMKILGLVGSPRKNSNTDLLVTAILAGAAKNKHKTEKVYLYNVDISPCVDCRACKQGYLQCSLKDGMQTLYPMLEAADVVIFGTPLYWYGPSAKMKLLLDRLRPFIASKKLKGKKAVLVVPSEEGADACNHTVGMFNMSVGYLEMDLVSVLLPKTSELAEVKELPDVLHQARTIGKQHQINAGYAFFFGTRKWLSLPALMYSPPMPRTAEAILAKFSLPKNCLGFIMM